MRGRVGTKLSPHSRVKRSACRPRRGSFSAEGREWGKRCNSALRLCDSTASLERRLIRNPGDCAGCCCCLCCWRCALACCLCCSSSAGCCWSSAMASFSLWCFGALQKSGDTTHNCTLVFPNLEGGELSDRRSFFFFFFFFFFLPLSFLSSELVRPFM